jgi:hypothetical protein
MLLCVRPLIRSPCALILFLLGCNANTAAVVGDADVKPAGAQFVAEAGHSPPFARMPYEAFGRAEAVAIAVQEWRLFGEPVDDDPPPPGGFDPAPGDDPARVGGSGRMSIVVNRRGQECMMKMATKSTRAATSTMHGRRHS